MSKRIKELFLFDNFVAICKIQHTIKDFLNGNELKYNYLAWDSVIREFEIIGEATKNLINLNVFDKSQRDIVNFRNILIHEYFGINEDEVYDIAKNKLDFFKRINSEKITEIDTELGKELLDDILEENIHLSFIVDELENFYNLNMGTNKTSKIKRNR